MNDNGGTAGVQVFNAGMHGSKGTPWMGGTRASSFWRWPGTLNPTVVNKLTAHVDFFPTLAELAGATLNDSVRQQGEGRSLLPLLKDPNAAWEDRTLVTHVGRWAKGSPPENAKYQNCSVRTTRWHLVSAGGGNGKGKGKESHHWQLFDVQADPGEKTDIAAQHPDVVAKMNADYDVWWKSVQPQLVNEDAVGPAENSFKTLYQQQFGEGASEKRDNPPPSKKKNAKVR
jgi:arylsulfatase